MCTYLYVFLCLFHNFIGDDTMNVYSIAPIRIIHYHLSVMSDTYVMSNYYSDTNIKLSVLLRICCTRFWLLCYSPFTYP